MKADKTKTPKQGDTAKEKQDKNNENPALFDSPKVLETTKEGEAPKEIPGGMKSELQPGEDGVVLEGAQKEGEKGNDVGEVPEGSKEVVLPLVLVSHLSFQHNHRRQHPSSQCPYFQLPL